MPDHFHSRGAPGRLWFFDLDNTLHDASHKVFPAINANMNAYIGGVLSAAGLPSDPAAIDAARLGYLRRYGATLLGMVHHHQVVPADFLAAAHRFDDLPAMLRTEPGIGRQLARLPGRKILLTNGPRHYAGEVLRHVGLHRHFAGQIPIEAMRVHGRLAPKPSRALLRKLLARHRMPARRCILVEDTLASLKAAKSLGMRTVWITGFLRAGGAKPGAPAAGNAVDVAKTRKRPGYVDVKVQSVKQLLDTLSSLSRK